ncbi:EAL domain-containing protein [Massilia arenosa]|uniref:EAL domain-containing protein n=1 Tax=Zemynaea arenosa TaxID=2561931 RepID=A0A4Y9RSQ3_9BURK|nr:EAL domain-containing protein [Massilia arenosa]TFW10806.1 EAL domain-containing protein [Massilia arenosa]
MPRQTRPVARRQLARRRHSPEVDDGLPGLFRDHPQPMWIYDLRTLRFMAVNEAARREYGYSESEFLRMTIRDIRPPAEQERLSANLSVAAPRAFENAGVWTHRRKDGSLLDVQVTSQGLRYRGRACRFVLVHNVSGYLSVQRALHQSEQLYRSLIDALPQQVFWKGLDQRYQGGNKEFARVAGLASTGDLVGKTDADFPWHYSAARIAEEDAYIMRTGQARLAYEDRLLEPDGSQRDYVINKLPLHDADGQIVGLLGTIQDITERKQAAQSLQLQSSAVEASVNAIIITRVGVKDDVVEYVNPAFTQMTGFAADEVMGRDCRFLQAGDTEQPALADLRRALHEERAITVVLRNYRKDGSLFWNELRVAPVRDAQGAVTHWVGILNDITATRRYQAELEHQASHDALTSLPNRALFNDRLEHAIAHASRYGHKVWVVFIDLDNFKLVNDTLGHGVGDSLLQTVAQRLSRRLRSSDTVARLGGDEFMLLLLDDGEQHPTGDTIAALLNAVAAPVRLSDREFSLTCSIGVAIFPGDGSAPQELLKHADMAMYQAKDAGRNQIKFFSAEMNEQVKERTLIEHSLRAAVVRSQFVLHYQPSVCLTSGTVKGVEALVRWNHPELGMVPPARFIPVAEDTGLIVDIGSWVLREACAQGRRWIDSGVGRFSVAVNVSARQFRRPSFAAEVREALRETGLPADLLDLEITESVVMADVQQAVEVMAELKEIGVRMSIDDFGTGYSSLSYLRLFPLDYLKIDQSFIAEMGTPSGDAMVRSIVMLGHSLDFGLIAEGVETAAQRDHLRDLGCDQMQGYLFSRPQPADALEALLAASAGR